MRVVFKVAPFNILGRDEIPPLSHVNECADKFPPDHMDRRIVAHADPDTRAVKGVDNHAQRLLVRLLEDTSVVLHRVRQNFEEVIFPLYVATPWALPLFCHGDLGGQSEHGKLQNFIKFRPGDTKFHQHPTENHDFQPKSVSCS